MMNDGNIQIQLDQFEALHATKAILDCVTALNTKASALNRTQDFEEASIMRENAKTLEGIAVKLSKGLANEGVDLPFVFKACE